MKREQLFTYKMYTLPLLPLSTMERVKSPPSSSFRTVSLALLVS